MSLEGGDRDTRCNKCICLEHLTRGECARVQLVLSLRIALSLNVRAFFPGCSIPSIHFLPAQQQISISTRSTVCPNGLISRPILQLVGAQLSLPVHCCSLFTEKTTLLAWAHPVAAKLVTFCGVAPAQAVCQFAYNCQNKVRALLKSEQLPGDWKNERRRLVDRVELHYGLFGCQHFCQLVLA